ncbi:uncharacterized protein BDW47DRAFT_73187 [Aspergillus candidus]|uniref:Uncharacterized protein n=1 Tax=Aspergillus candidus TaxID=41067 RepID=A0A2I2F205_ASPCN|nr:hypothetical protein BDW47DRAFT_73187 [Aspergillus candidus]PLB34664.1 hypothetical protein BDW47DRAFT_73187 [Aspergillus candidus]
MKSAFVAFAALAGSAVAAPTGALSAVTKTFDTVTSVSISSIPAATSEIAISPSGVVSPSPVVSPSGVADDGHLLKDIGHGANKVLTVTGQDTKKLLVKLSPEVSHLLSGLGLPEVGVPAGKIVKTAGAIGDLLQDIGEAVDGLITVVDKDLGAVLIQLDPEVTGLISGLGLPVLGNALGEVVGTLGENLKRSDKDGLLEDAAPVAKDILQVTGEDSKQLLVKLSPEVAELISGLGLPGVGSAIGKIVKTAGGVGDLLKDLAWPVEQLLTVVGEDGSHLLIHLEPSVVGLLTGLGLPALGHPLGHVVGTVGENL